MLIVMPEVPAVPAKRTSPAAAARTAVPTEAAMSIPRCCPAAFGSVPFRYGVITSPVTGQVHAAWAGGVKAKNAMKKGTSRRIGRTYDRRADRSRGASRSCGSSLLGGQGAVQRVCACARQGGDYGCGLARMRARVDE